MILHKINIKNYRSVEDVTLAVNTVKNSYCFALLGINESGKSSILKGISLLDNPSVSFPLDYFNKEKRIEVKTEYKIESYEEEKLKSQIKAKLAAPDKFIKKIKVTNIMIKRSIENDDDAESEKSEHLEWTTETVNGFVLENNAIVEKSGSEVHLGTMMKNYFPEFFWIERHRTVFWEPLPNYLITEPIDLDKFANDPKETSLPLYNTLKLTGIDDADIKQKINGITTPTDCVNFSDLLSDKLTDFINDKWKHHPIKIKISINDDELSFLVADDDIPYKAKVVQQRSDGFKQLVSFLLTVAVENNNEDFRYRILLLDEPETRLHPSAQIDLLNELLKIGNKTESDNVVFYSTHSPYMIDKKSLNRSIKVIKQDNERTIVERVKTGKTTYAEVNFELFDIPTTDYHNELFGLIEAKKKNLFDRLPKDKKWQNVKNGRVENVSLSTYIRHSIHHPENDKNRKYSLVQLNKSIKMLRELRDKL